MEPWVAPVIVGVMSSITGIIIAIIQHGESKKARDLQMTHLDQKLDGLVKDIECVDKKVEDNAAETIRIKGRVIALETRIGAYHSERGI